MSTVAPNSPCISVCSLDPTGHCRGCYRTRDEIAGWIRMTAAQQWSVVRACEERRAAHERRPAAARL
ncbi:MAG: DUF1289 domain-containing protein [Steroidobacteraceae bacterium]|jgi:predicted Fe-S protein YdhL (DUF1289 family)|nr:DUF1289 domain-containing protein [Steroidobacteraceae bacterium]